MTHGVLAPQRSMFTSRRTVNGSRLSPSPWVRPADWLPITPPVPSDKRIVGLHAVQNGGSNFVRVTCRGAYRVDWGDGAGWTNYADNTPAEKNLSWGDYSSGTLTAAGYRQAIITVEAQAGQNLTQVYLNERHSASSQTYGTGWLDVAIASSSTVDLRITGFNGVTHPMLERFTCDASLTSVGPSFSQSYALRSVSLDTSSVTNFTNMFYGCSSLQTVPALNTAAGTNFAAMFQNCYSLQTVPALNTAAGTNFTYMFYGCYSLQQVPALNTAAGTNFTYMFRSCSSLQTVPALNTAAGTDFTYMFYGCSSLQTVPALNTAAGTNFTDMFRNCYSLQQSDITGTTYAISYASANLSAAALNNIYTKLGTAAGAQTITVTSNWGTAGDDPTIATAKGWTVAGS